MSKGAAHPLEGRPLVVYAGIVCRKDAIVVLLSAGMDASVGAPVYERHRPEKTLLYQLVEQHYPVFVTQLAAEGKVLPGYVHEEFEAYLKCGRPGRPHSSMAFSACSATAVTLSSW